MQTSLPAAAAAGILIAAAVVETVEANQPGRGAVPGGTPIGCVQGVPGVEGPIAGGSVLAFVVPAKTDRCLEQKHVCC